MKDFLSWVHVVVRTLNLEISRCHSTRYVKGSGKSRAARAAQLFFLIQPIGSLFSGIVTAVAYVLALAPYNHATRAASLQVQSFHIRPIQLHRIQVALHRRYNVHYHVLLYCIWHEIFVMFFAGLVCVISGLRPENFSKNNLRVFSRSKQANFSLKWELFCWGNACIFKGKKSFLSIFN